MLLEDFIDAADSWADLGWAIQDQARDLIAGAYDAGSLNSNAVSEIARFADTLYNYHGIDTDKLHAAIDDYESLEEDDE